MILLPTFKDSNANYQYFMDIETQSVNFTFRYNERNESWTMDIANNDYTIYGIKLVINSLLLEPYRAWMPNISGDFIILQMTKKTTEFSYDDFNLYYGLYYLSEDEVAEWRILNGF